MFNPFNWFKKDKKWASYVLTLDQTFDPATGMQILIAKANSLGLQGKTITNITRKERPFSNAAEVWFEGVTK